MKKTFLKATLFSLMVAMVPSVITSCKDYDDDIKSLTTKDDQLQQEISDKLAQQETALTNQIKALETALAEQKQAAAQATEAAKAAADAAQAAADKAQATADAGVKAAAEADAKAQAANAEAEAAKAAAAQAKADAIEEAKAMVEALQKEVAAQIAELDQKYGDLYKELAAAVGKAATQESLDAAVKQLQKSISDLETKFNASEAKINETLADYLAKINKNTADIVVINGKIDGINTEINTLKTDLGKLEGRVAANEAEISKNAGAIANNAKLIADNQAAIATITMLALNNQQEIEKLNSALQSHISAFNAYQTQVTNELVALNKFRETYTQLMENLTGRVDGIDKQIVEILANLGTVTADLAQAQKDILANAAAIKSLQGTVANNKEELDGRIGSLSDRLDSAIETLNEAITTAQNALQASIDQTAEAAAANLKAAKQELQDKIDTINEAIDGINETIGKHDARITALEGTVKTQGEAIEKLGEDLAEVQREILKTLNANLSTLQAINAKRLTSVTLVPTSYVGGIPTIDFFSADFVPMVKVADTTNEYAPSTDATAKHTIITNNDTEAFYRLNPSGVALEDIVADNVTFVQQIATSRASEDDCVIEVAGVKKGENGKLIVNATKAPGFTSTLNSAGENKIYTVSLRVPIAPKNYFTWTDNDGNQVTEDKNDAVVYSEYTRIAETTFTPGIAAVYGDVDLPLSPATQGKPWDHADNNPNNFFYTKDQTLGSTELVYVNVPYNTVDFDLTQYVTACKTVGTGTSAVTSYLDNYATYPFTFSYEFVPTEDTKDYAKVTAEGLLTATNPQGNASITSASRIGKVVTVRVTMKYQDQVVDQKYFNVKYVLTEKNITVRFDDTMFKHFEWNLYSPISTTFTDCKWDDVTAGDTTDKGFISKLLDEIHAALKNNDFQISRAEFNASYSVGTITKAYVNPATENGEEEAVTDVDCVKTNLTAANDWIVKENAVATDFYEVDGVGGKGIKVIVTFEPQVDGFPNVTLVLSGKVVWPEVPVFGRVDKPRTWTEVPGKNQFNTEISNFEQTQKLAPMSYEVAAQNGITEVAYNGSVLTGRTVPYILNLNDLSYPDPSAPVWDIQVSDKNASTKPYEWLVDGSDEVAATVWYKQNHKSSYDLGYTSANGEGILAAADRYNNTVAFHVEDNEAGRILVNSGKPVVLDWKVYLNGKTANNLYTVGHTNMLIMKPITKVYFTTIPDIQQNFAEQSVNVASYLWAKDQYTTDDSKDYLNNEGGAFDASYEGKWKYYGFDNITYAIDMDKVPDTEVPYYTQMEIKVNETTGVLSFTTKNTTLTKPLNVYIKVKGDYKFGRFETEGTVTITNSSISSHAPRK